MRTLLPNAHRGEGGEAGKGDHMGEGIGAPGARHMGKHVVVRALGGDGPLFVAADFFRESWYNCKTGIAYTAD